MSHIKLQVNQLQLEVLRIQSSHEMELLQIQQQKQLEMERIYKETMEEALAEEEKLDVLQHKSLANKTKF